jgi:hypothetical protein
VDESSTVHRDAGDEATMDKVVNDWAQAGFDDVAAHAPETGFARVFGSMDCGKKVAEIVCCKEIGKRVQEIFERGILRGRFGKISDGDSAFAGSERVSGNFAKLKGRDGIDAHELSDNFSAKRT